MSIVSNEYAFAERAIKDRELGSKPYETLCRVAKYYFSKGMTAKEVRDNMDAFLLSCDRTASMVAWSDTLDKAVKYGAKYDMVMIDHVSISSTELEKIERLNGVQIRRLAFTLLCMAKYMVQVNKNMNNWVTLPDNEIMKLANINTSIKRQSAMLGELRNAGMIRFSKRIDNLSMQVLFVDNLDEAVRVSDFRNIGYQYMAIHDKNYYVCEECGIMTKRPAGNSGRGRKPKYCQICAAKIKMKQNVESVMRKNIVELN